MHNLKNIRNNFEFFKKNLKNRNVDLDLNKILDLDKDNRELISKIENFEREKREISKSKNEKLFQKSKKISQDIEELSIKQKNINIQLNNIISTLPNLALDSVPVGIDDKSNQLVEKKGKIRKFNFKPKSHYELGENLKMLDFDLATKTTGTRFAFVKGKLALFERAISTTTNNPT